MLLKHRGAASPIDAPAVQRLVAGAVSGLSPEDVAVVLLARPALAPSLDRSLAHLGPIAVTRGSAVYLRAFVALSLLVLVATLGTAVAFWSRARRLREAADERAPS